MFSDTKQDGLKLMEEIAPKTFFESPEPFLPQELPADVLPARDAPAPLDDLPDHLAARGDRGNGRLDGHLVRLVHPLHDALLEPLVHDGLAAGHVELEVDLQGGQQGEKGRQLFVYLLFIYYFCFFV